MAKPTARAYIDGHNFYHGCVKLNPEYKWLDLIAFASRLLPDCNVELVSYYTARVVDFPDDPSQSQRQDIYLQALRAIGVNVVEGKFKRRKKRVRLSGTEDFAKAELWEEKGTDVNLAVDLVADALRRDMDCALIVSNDFDLQRAVDIAVSEGVSVVVANPHRHHSKKDPSLTGSDTRNIRTAHLRDSQLRDVVLSARGEQLHRPPSWL